MPERNDKQLWKYAGMVMQFFTAIGIALFIGWQADKWLKTSIPVFAWALPLLAVIGIILQIIRDTSGKK